MSVYLYTFIKLSLLLCFFLIIGILGIIESRQNLFCTNNISDYGVLNKFKKSFQFNNFCPSLKPPDRNIGAFQKSTTTIIRYEKISLQKEIKNNEKKFFFYNEDNGNRIGVFIPPSEQLSKLGLTESAEDLREFLNLYPWRFLKSWALAIGYSIPELLSKGYRVDYLCKAGYTTDEFKSAGQCSISCLSG